MVGAGEIRMLLHLSGAARKTGHTNSSVDLHLSPPTLHLFTGVEAASFGSRDPSGRRGGMVVVTCVGCQAHMLGILRDILRPWLQLGSRGYLFVILAGARAYLLF